MQLRIHAVEGRLVASVGADGRVRPGRYAARDAQGAVQVGDAIEVRVARARVTAEVRSVTHVAAAEEGLEERT